MKINLKLSTVALLAAALPQWAQEPSGVGEEMKIAPGCVAPYPGMTNWYRFEKPNFLADKTGANPLGGAPAPSPGMVMSAHKFPGNTSLTAGNPMQPSFLTRDFSFDAWIFVPAAKPGVQVLVEKRAASPLQGWSFYLTDNKLGLQIAAGGNHWNYATSTPVPVNQWVLVAAVVRRLGIAPRAEFYYNGAPAGPLLNMAPGAGAANVDSSTAMKLGVRTISNDGFFTGALDEVELFNRALDPMWIKMLWSAKKNGKCVAQPNIVASYGKNALQNINLILTNNGNEAAQNVRLLSVTNVQAQSPNVIVFDQGVVGNSNLQFPWVWGPLNPAQSAARNLGFKATSGVMTVPFSFTVTYEADNAPAKSMVVNVPYPR